MIREIDGKHVFWQLDGSVRIMVYTLVAAHVGALVCSATTTNPSPAIAPHPNWRQIFWCLSLCKRPPAHAKEA